ncbi:MAG: aminopeptidase P family protein [Fimbriimonas ginsengisoli]|uniref:Aminopeptidase P family protein n=1 Tax=Fimbriimonas ginsengisoli TaxID=1005039 RepID=A0A931PUD0_FIMGI|nr:aminopeptidase P family protein [Fimbriimonas ginsengisoli]
MNNLNRLREAMKSRNLEALLLSDPVNVGWATGFTGSFGFALVTPDGGRFLTDSRYTLQAEEQVQGLSKHSFATPQTGEGFLAENVQAMALPRLAFEGTTVAYDTFTKWQSRLVGTELYSAGSVVGPLRMIKSPGEVAKIRNACKLTDACFDHVLRLVQPGVSEWDVQLDIEFYFRRNGAELAFAPIVVSGERSARPHGQASEKKLEKGDFLTMDFGAQVDGYCADLTRTVVVGEASERHREIYGQVLKAQLAAIGAMRPGVGAAEVDSVARTILDEKQLAKHFGHGLGHGLGRVVHDGGRLGIGSEDRLEMGQVWTVEPGVYIEGFGGVRIEDDVVVTESGVEVLTHSPKELLVLP